MKLAAVIAAALTIATAAAAATAPAGFYEAKRLEPAASYVAGKPSQVFCTEDHYTWLQFVKQSGDTMSDSGAITYAGQATSYISPGLCPTLLRELSGRKVDNYAFAGSLLTLVHEAIHQRGVSDEAVTECDAIHLVPRVAVRFFHVRAGKPLRAFMAQVWLAHQASGADYTSVC